MSRKNILLVVVAVIAIVAVVVYTQKYRKGDQIIKDSGDNISDYSAVFLTNNQVYFGKITGDDQKTLDLVDIYYLQVGAQTQATPEGNAANQPGITLLKLGNELHGPNDAMHINRDHVLFIESLRKDSTIVSKIQEAKNQK